MSTDSSTRPVLGISGRTASRLSASARRILLVEGELHRVRAGRLLLTAQGTLVLATAEVLQPSRSDVVGLVLISSVVTALLIGSYLVRWDERSAATPVLFAVTSVAAFLLLGLSTAATVAPVTGFLTATVVHVGLTQPLRLAAAIVPLAGPALGANFTPVTGDVAIRVMVAMSVWLVTVVTLCWLIRSNSHTAAALRRSALMDALTGIPNRRDLNHFKLVNDTRGHEAGVAVLRRFGTLLRNGLRNSDYCARLGGEEFVIIFDAATSDAHQAVIDRLRAQWSRLQPDITFSTGCATRRPERNGRNTLQAADRALYLAKRSGRNTDRAECDLDRAATPRARRVMCAPHHATQRQAEPKRVGSRSDYACR